MNVDELLEEWRQQCVEELRLVPTTNPDRTVVSVPAFEDWFSPRPVDYDGPVVAPTQPTDDRLDIVIDRADGAWHLVDLEATVGRVWAEGTAIDDRARDRISSAVERYGAKLDGDQVVAPLGVEPSLADIVRFVQAITAAAAAARSSAPAVERGEQYRTRVLDRLAEIVARRGDGVQLRRERVTPDDDQFSQFYADAGLWSASGKTLRAQVFVVTPSNAAARALSAAVLSGKAAPSDARLLELPSVQSLGLVERATSRSRARRTIEPWVDRVAAWSVDEDDPQLEAGAAAVIGTG